MAAQLIVLFMAFERLFGRTFFYRRDCEITFIIGRGFAELQILKK